MGRAEQSHNHTNDNTQNQRADGDDKGGNWHEQGDMYADYCKAARAAANELKIRYVPLDTMFRDEWRRHPGHTGLLLTKDGVHPTAEGYKMIAETFLKAWNQ